MESLGYRATPSTLDVGGLAQPFPGGTVTTIQNAPVIINFSCVETQPGVCTFTGQVLDNSPGGLTISFGGVPSLAGKTAVTNADGTFTLIVSVHTDGSDAGTVTAQTTDLVGLQSNIATYYINPT